MLDLRWTEIPAGDLPKGGKRAKRNIESLAIARCPVTQANSHSFLDTERRDAKKARWPIPNRPRDSVSWFEAMPFCVRLTNGLIERLRLTGHGRLIRLATDWEWERAARGVDGRLYSWGDD